MQRSDRPRVADVSAGPAGAESDLNSARQAALAVVAWWHAVSDALAPMLGLRGVGALYQRTLHLAAGSHPFLVSVDGPGADLDLAALQALLVQQTELAVTAAGATLAATLSSLLEGLVGPSLTERLLHDVQAPPTGANPAQDPSS